GAGSAKSSDSLLQRRRGLEPDGLAGLHLDLLAGAGVEPLARLGLAHGEGAEARQREAAVALQLLHDRAHQVAGGAVRGRAGELRRTLDDLRDECLRHRLSLLIARMCPPRTDSEPGTRRRSGLITALSIRRVAVLLLRLSRISAPVLLHCLMQPIWRGSPHGSRAPEIRARLG